MKLPSSSATNLNKPNLEHMVSMKDFSVKEMDNMMELMAYLKQARADNALPQLFKNKSVGMIFEAGSTRTRVSFETAATLLGGHGLFLSPKDIHLGARSLLTILPAFCRACVTSLWRVLTVQKRWMDC